MLTKGIEFGAGAFITPDLAAKIAQCAAMYDAKVYVEYKGVELCVDSLIGILSMDIQNGSKMNVEAEGNDAEKVLKEVCSILIGEKR